MLRSTLRSFNRLSENTNLLNGEGVATPTVINTTTGVSTSDTVETTTNKTADVDGVFIYIMFKHLSDLHAKMFESFYESHKYLFCLRQHIDGTKLIELLRKYPFAYIQLSNYADTQHFANNLGIIRVVVASCIAYMFPVEYIVNLLNYTTKELRDFYIKILRSFVYGPDNHQAANVEKELEDLEKKEMLAALNRFSSKTK